MRILQVQGAGRGLVISFILPDMISSGQLELEEETVCVNGDEIP